MAFHFQRTRLMGVVLISALTSILWLRDHQIHREQEQPFGRLTAAQVIALSGPICRSIAPEARELRFSARTYQGDHLWWNVACRDQSDREVANLDWIPETGELFEVGAWPYHPQERPHTSLSAQEAASRMRRWLGVLRPGASTGWRLAGTPVADYNRNWAAEWVNRGARCITKIDGRSGELLLARFGHNKKG